MASFDHLWISLANDGQRAILEMLARATPAAIPSLDVAHGAEAACVRLAQHMLQPLPGIIMTYGKKVKGAGR